ncbi:MAG: endolytic transglycosylase MltG [Blastocatellia bacterium]
MQRRQYPQRKRRSLFSRFLILLALGGAALIGGWIWLTNALDSPHKHEVRRTITIDPGSKTSEIVYRLHREGILESELPMRLWMRFFSEGRPLKAGDYDFKSPITARQVINQLIVGGVATRQFTIPEGYNQFDIARVIADLQGLKEPSATVERVLSMFKHTSLIEDLDPDARTLEGYLFPDTYEYTTNTTREKLVEAMVKRFRKVYTAQWQDRASELGWKTRQVVTLASLIEKEAQVDSERELISQVFHKRLKMGSTLACDPTVIYAALIEGKYRGKIYQSDLDRDSPYNTYKRAGLPPGPIASPGKRSIEAALYPAATDYLFFVVDATRNDGSHKFSASSGEHVRAVQILRQQEREQRSR